MAKYSYKEGLDYNLNPLFKDINKKMVTSIAIFSVIFFILALGGVFILVNPVFKYINILTRRAEKIVEGDFNEEGRIALSEGSLYRFISKFNLMEDRVKNSLDLLKEEKVNLKNIINDISHQLKTPLMALGMYNDILIDYDNMEKEEVQEFMSLSREQLDRMDWLVKTLLKYARLESNVVKYEKEDYPLSSTIEESISPLLVKAEEKNQEVIFNNENSAKYYHDRKWIEEAFSNIIKNAIEHTGNGGTIKIGLEETPLAIVVSIADNGEGIEKKNIKKIFKRFYKGESSVNPTSIGIGLSLSKAIIEAHKGSITVESEVGVGTTFYITFLKNIV